MARLTQFRCMALLALLFLTISVVQSVSVRTDEDDVSNELLDARGLDDSSDTSDEELLRIARLDIGSWPGKAWSSVRNFFHNIGIGKREQQIEILRQILRAAEGSSSLDSMPSFEDAEDFHERDHEHSRTLRKKRQAVRAH